MKVLKGIHLSPTRGSIFLLPNFVFWIMNLPLTSNQWPQELEDTDSPVTFAVGTAHMLGNLSIVALLKDAGYDVRRVKTADVINPSEGPTESSISKPTKKPTSKPTKKPSTKPPKGAGNRCSISPALLIMILLSFYILFWTFLFSTLQLVTSLSQCSIN